MPRTKKHPGRKRRIGGWVLVSLAVLVAGMWVASGWSAFTCPSGNWTFWLDEGCLGATHSKVISSQSGWRVFGTTLDLTIADPGFHGLAWRAKMRRPPTVLFTYVPRESLTVDGLLVGASHNQHTDESGFNFSDRTLVVVAWPIPLLLTAAGAPLLLSGMKARRRAAAGACPACGYDKRGLAAGAPCPECGK